MKINLELLTDQANGFGQLLFAEYGEKKQPLPEWAEGLMNLLCGMEHALHASNEITLTKTKEKD